MNNVVNIASLKNDKAFKNKMKKLDAQACYTIIEICLKQLDLCKMEELECIKNKLSETMSVLYKIGKND